MMASRGEVSNDLSVQKGEITPLGETKEVVFSMVGGSHTGKSRERLKAFRRYMDVVNLIGNIPGVARVIPEVFTREEDVRSRRTRSVGLELYPEADFKEVLDQIRNIKPVINAVDQATLV